MPATSKLRIVAIMVACVLAVALLFFLLGWKQVTGCPAQEPGGTEECVTSWQWHLP